MSSPTGAAPFVSVGSENDQIINVDLTYCEDIKLDSNELTEFDCADLYGEKRATVFFWNGENVYIPYGEGVNLDFEKVSDI